MLKEDIDPEIFARGSPKRFTSISGSSSGDLPNVEDKGTASQQQALRATFNNTAAYASTMERLFGAEIEAVATNGGTRTVSNENKRHNLDKKRVSFYCVVLELTALAFIISLNALLSARD